MKLTNNNQVTFFEHSTLYHVVYEQNHYYNNKIIIAKPFDLAPEYLKKTPIRLLFVKNSTNEILFEIKIKNQAQIAHVFKFLQFLNFSKQSITSIISPILSTWNQDLKENTVETVLYPKANKFYLEAVNNINKS